MPDPTNSDTAKILEAIRWRARRINSEWMDERRAMPLSWQADCAAAGLFGLQIPEEYGGQGLSWRDMIAVMQQVGATNCNDATGVVVANTLGPPPIVHFAPEKLKKEILPQLASGQALSTSAISEPGMGSYLKGITTRADKQPDGSYRLNGEKKWISLGGDARYVNVFAQTYGEDGTKAGISGFLVDATSPGFRVGPAERTLGLRGLPQNVLLFEDLHVPADTLLAREGDGLVAAKHAFQTGRLVLATAILGAAKRALQLAHRFARRRQVATGLLADNGENERITAEAVAAIQAVDLLVTHTADRLDAGDHCEHLLYIAKTLGCELMWRVIDDSVQILGARGFLDTNVVGQMYRDYRLFRIFEGSTHTVWGYQGAMLRKRREEFLALTAEFDTPEDVRALIEECADLTEIDTPPGSRRHRHANSIGQLAGWSVLAALTSDAARRDPQHEFVAAWSARTLRARLDAARENLDVEIPTSTELRTAIETFAHEIGDLTQHRPGENWEMDELLLP